MSPLTAETVPPKVTQTAAAAAAAASPETAKKQVDALLESRFKLMEVVHQMAASAEQRNGMSVFAIKKALDAKGHKTVTHKFQVRSSLKGLTEESFLTQTKGISATDFCKHKRATRQIIRPRWGRQASPRNVLTVKRTVRKPNSPPNTYQNKKAVKKTESAAESKTALHNIT
uniref:H15 domain-containing protein n=1 Tax=Callorhinchus milii TaxID=7868 RepID=A0A4W3IJ78_CALMI